MASSGREHSRIVMYITRFLTAVRFLTIIPVSWRAQDDSSQFNKCLLFFPVVGALIGFVGYWTTYITLLFFPQPVAAVFALICLAFISGCLHLDGLADSADGLLSARPRETCLRIMKDSRTGAMGVIVVVCVMLAKYGALSSMAPEKLCLAVFFMPLAGRCAILFSMSRLQYAREEGGLGQLFYSESSKTAALGALMLLLLLLAFLSPSLLVFTLVAVLLVNLLFNRWCRVQLGGATGDTLGAVCELTEMVVAIAFSATFALL